MNPSPSPLVRRPLPLYPVLADLPTTLRDTGPAEHAQAISVPEGQLLLDEGAPCRGSAMLRSGAVRVARGTPNGRPLELYRVGPGELGVATTTACLSGQALRVAHGVSVQPSELVVLSPVAFERRTAVDAFRRFVFGMFADRLADLMALAEAVVLQRLDPRVASKLLGHGSVVHATHQALADDLGTVREMITRLLERFERAGWVAIGRDGWRSSTPRRSGHWLQARAAWPR